MIVAVVVHVEDADEFGVVADANLLGVLDAFGQRLAGVLLHLDVVELTAQPIKKRWPSPVDEICERKTKGKR